jgi:hypothetical protein
MSCTMNVPLVQRDPSPLVGEGRVGGREVLFEASTPAQDLPTPTPSPSPQGGGELSDAS